MEISFLTEGEGKICILDLTCGVALELEIAVWSYGFQYVLIDIKVHIDVNMYL